MKESVEEIINILERVQELIHRGMYNEAATAAHGAQCLAIFMRDHEVSNA